MKSKGKNISLLENSKKSTLDDLQVGYQGAIQMAVYDGHLSWQITGLFMQLAILMIVGAVFPSFVGSKDELTISIAGLLVSFAGLTMTSMFSSMIMRIRTYEEYWVLCVMDLESRLGEQVTTFEGSSRLSSERNISVIGKTIKMGKFAAIKSKIMLRAFYILFFISFLVLLGINIRRLILVLCT